MDKEYGNVIIREALMDVNNNDVKEVQPPEQDNKVILIIEKDINHATVFRNNLEHAGYHVVMALTLRKGFDLFYAMTPDFVILDADLDEMRAHVKEFISSVLQNHIPIALVGENVTDEKRARIYQTGATDIIDRKMLDATWFLPYLENRLNFQQKVFVDELTGASNRKYMDRIVEDLMNRYIYDKELFSLVMIDIDHFKTVNDTYGHINGDIVLKRLVEIINQYTRSTDDVCRFGGEEFMISLPRTSSTEAYEIVERIRHIFNWQQFEVEGKVFRVSFSAGVETVDDEHQSVPDLIEEADRALYQSKETGRNKTTIYQKNAERLQQKLNIIVVDDDKLTREIVSQSFADLEFGTDLETEIRTYSDGADFIHSDWYEAGHKYIILLDGIMPKMNGTEVLKEVRTHYPDENIVILMLSARQGEAAVVQALEKGADDYVLKPFNIPELFARVQRLSKRMLF